MTMDGTGGAPGRSVDDAGVGMANRVREVMANAGGTPPRRRKPSSASRRPGDGYSRFVRLAKLMLPGIAIAVMALALLWPSLQRTRDDVVSSVKSTIAGTKFGNFVMVNPKYYGVDKEGRPFKIEAKQAQQHGPKATKVSLTAPKGSMTLASGNWVAMSAKAGEYDQKTKVLILNGDVNIYHDAKYTFKTDQATIDVKTNEAWGDKPVVVNGPKADIEAEGFRVKDKGKTVVFTGKAKVLLRVDNQDIGAMTVDGKKAGDKPGKQGSAKGGSE